MDLIRFMSIGVACFSFSAAHMIPQYGLIPRQGMLAVFLSSKALQIQCDSVKTMIWDMRAVWTSMSPGYIFRSSDLLPFKCAFLTSWSLSPDR